jgi:hypothetical protein
MAHRKISIVCPICKGSHLNVDVITINQLDACSVTFYQARTVCKSCQEKFSLKEDCLERKPFVFKEVAEDSIIRNITNSLGMTCPDEHCGGHVNIPINKAGILYQCFATKVEADREKDISNNRSLKIIFFGQSDSCTECGKIWKLEERTVLMLGVSDSKARIYDSDNRYTEKSRGISKWDGRGHSPM